MSTTILDRVNCKIVGDAGEYDNNGMNTHDSYLKNNDKDREYDDKDDDDDDEYDENNTDSDSDNDDSDNSIPNSKNSSMKYSNKNKSSSTSSVKDDILLLLKQHYIAIVIAIIATIVVQYYNSTNSNSRQQASTRSGNTIGLVPTTLWQSQRILQEEIKLQQHIHLQYYQRTANITFCEDDNDVNDSEIVSLSESSIIVSTGSQQRRQVVETKKSLASNTSRNKNLAFMDFSVPTNLLSAIEAHFHADNENDNMYEKTMRNFVKSQSSSISSSILPLLSSNHPQYKCITKQLTNNERIKREFIKGYTMYYPSPSIESMYRQHVEYNTDIDYTTQLAAATTITTTVNNKNKGIVPALLTFTGFGAKFVNMSPKSILLYWDGRSGDKRTLVGEINPYEAISTATTPGQSFSVSPVYDYTIELNRWVVTPDDAIIYYYDKSISSDSVTLSKQQQLLYNLQLLNKEFAKHYQIASKRPWLAHFPRPFPAYHMWDASYFNQTHTVHITQPIQSTSATPSVSDDTVTETIKSYTMNVESVTPKVFTIPNFLTNDECDQLITTAKNYGKMEKSSVYAGGGSSSSSNNKRNNTATFQQNLQQRSSSNIWLSRDTTSLTDDIYRRIGQLLHIDESLLQKPIDDTIDAQYHSIVESLQIVRYKQNEQYTPHHDWIIPVQQTNRYQPIRYATVLLYLNDNFTGGYTTFPRSVQTQYHDGIKIKPKKGTAVLFYNILPDGNVDDLSQHSSEPIIKGEKYIANLWVWEPLIS